MSSNSTNTTIPSSCQFINFLLPKWIPFHIIFHTSPNTHTHTQPFYGPLGFCLGLPGWAGSRKVKKEGKTDLDLLEQEIVSGSGISCAICKCAPWPRHNHTTIPPLSFLQAGCPSRCPTNSIKALKATESTNVIVCLDVHHANFCLKQFPSHYNTHCLT